MPSDSGSHGGKYCLFRLLAEKDNDVAIFLIGIIDRLFTLEDRQDGRRTPSRWRHGARATVSIPSKPRSFTAQFLSSRQLA